jgi:hypothetical protein
VGASSAKADGAVGSDLSKVLRTKVERERALTPWRKSETLLETSELEDIRDVAHGHPIALPVSWSALCMAERTGSVGVGKALRYVFALNPPAELPARHP